MPMYEKGSVRAEPRSKQQERMKKIMKKFLSSLLALTMILSLVIVPANASDNTIGGVSIAPKSVSLKVGEETEITVNTNINEMFNTGEKLTVDGTEYTLTEAPRITVGSIESNDNSVVTVTADSSGRSGVATAKAVAKGKATISCTVTCNYKYNDGVKDIDATATQTLTTKVTVAAPEVTYTITGTPAVKAKVGGKEVSNVKHDTTVDFSIDGDITVKSKTGDANEVTLTKDKDYTLEYAWSGVSGSSASVSQKLTNTTSSPKTVTAGCTITVKVDGKTVGSPVNCTAAKVTVASEPSISITGSVQKVGENYEVLKGGRLELTASAPGVENPTYKWYVNDSIDSSHGRNEKYILTASDTTRTGPTTVTCKVFSGDNETPVKETTCTYKIVDENVRLTLNKESVTLSKRGAYEDITASVIDWPNQSAVTGMVKYTFTPSKRGVVSLSSSENTTGKTRITLDANDTVTITVEATYKGKTLDAKTIYVTGELLSASLDKVENGDPLKFDYDDLEAAANKALPSRVSVKKNSYINLSGVPTAADEGGVLYYGSNKVSASGRNIDKNDSLEFRTAAGFIGDATMTMTVSGDDNKSYTITLTIPVISAGNIKETVTGNAANKDVTFTNSDYKYLYYTTSKVSDYNGYYDGSSKVGKFDGLVKEDKTVTIPASAFKDKTTVTLYVVGLDKYGVASTGTIEVSQKSHDITYNVVAGKSVTFDQKAFDRFLEDYAEDNGNYNPKKDEITFDHATLNSLPTAKSEGTLYYGGSEVTSTSNRKAEYTDMDKMTFEAVAKPTKDTVTLTFRVYGEIEKPNSRKPDKVNYDVNVVISVVKEDITYTVGIDDTVQLTARDFVNFLQDARTSYRKAELDYVKFDVSGKNVSSYAYGGLYRSYSSYSTGKLADSTDKFYYEPSRTQYDLADVAYHTTRWAEAGKTVYIPFTVYGTKNEEASGTMAITIAQTMNFIDVKASDFFYEPVKWAVNNKITNGTSSTTFSPYKNCNRAEIVTFLWRAAGSPEPTVTRNPFKDVNAVTHSSYYKAILWASQKGITAGTTATTFSPYQECTRSQIVTFLYRYAGKPSGYYSNPFKDVSSVNEASYYNAILWAVGKGITQGTSTTTFSPYASCTRGEAVTFLYRYVNGVK